MRPASSPRLQAQLQRFSRGAGVGAIALGALVLIGWNFLPFRVSLEWLRALLSTPLSACCFVVTGAALLLSQPGAPAVRRRVAQALAVSAMGVGLLSLGEHLTGFEVGWDRVLFHDTLLALGWPDAGRPAPQTALSFVLLGLGILALDAPRPRRFTLSEALMLAAAVLPFAAVLSHAYDLGPLLPVFSALQSISLSTAALGLLLLMVGVFFARPDRGLALLFSSTGAGGVVARTVLPVFLLLPILVGWLRTLGARTGLVSIAAGTAMMATLISVFAFGVLIWIGFKLDRVDAERQAAEQALMRQATELRDANERLLELNRLKTDFVNAVSHELRTPLTSIVGYAEFLEDEVGGPLAPQQQGFVEQVRVGAERLRRLVDDLLDFARLEAGTFTLSCEASDLKAKVAEVVESVRPQAQAASLALELAAPESAVRVRMDPYRIGQVLLNLLSNAIKFTPAGGAVRVRVEEAPGAVRLMVADTGPGIAPEHQARLFDRFYQVDPSSTREHGGAGLGLSICKAIVEAHGGTISVESEPGRGATFLVTLPRDGRDG